MNNLENLVSAIAEVGLNNDLPPPISNIQPFKHFFENGKLDQSALDERDGGCTRRELLTRALLLNAVLDQGPDIEGVRDLMVQVVNKLYENEVRIFHQPLDFFKEVGISVDSISGIHESIKSQRAEQWAQDNETTEAKYNLYMDGTTQTMSYAVFRWGVPLALPYLLSKQANVNQETALIDYLEKHDSAEIMSENLKQDGTYGLGKAIGNKACHLFAKWIVSTFKLTRKNNLSWGEFSYEVPFDSNAGRVLWRTGYLLELAELDLYKKKEVVQEGKGKKGTNYIRVTNIRGVKIEKSISEEMEEVYKTICCKHLMSNKRPPRKVEIQKFQHVLLQLRQKSNPKYTVAAFDDGLIAIGRNYCLNHDKPRCSECPINAHCQGYQNNPSLIKDYTT